MKYNDLRTSSNLMTTDIIFTAMSFYKELIKRPLYIKRNENSNSKTRIKKGDIIIVSLFLSFLYQENIVNNILEENGIVYSNIIKQLDLDEFVVDNSANEDYSKIYNEAFRPFINKMLYLSKNLYYCNDYDGFSNDMLYVLIVEPLSSESNIIYDLLISSGIDRNTIINVKSQIADFNGLDDRDADNSLLFKTGLGSPSFPFYESNRGKLNINNFGKYLTDKDYFVDPAFKREDKIKELMYALATPKMSAVVVGEQGVGKTVLIEGLAYRIKKGEVPPYFKDSKIFSVAVTNIVNGTTYRGELEENFLFLINKIKEEKNTMLFIDEFHSVIGGGASANDSNDIANMLKPHLDDGNLKVIGATTTEEYNKYLAANPALKRRFECIKLKEQDKNIIHDILLHTISLYEHEQQITFGPIGKDREVIIRFIVEATAKKHRIYNDMQFNPALALSILAKAFGIATVELSKEVTKLHIAKAIAVCDRLGPDSRLHKSRELQQKNLSGNNQKTNGYEKVISISNYSKRR